MSGFGAIFKAFLRAIEHVVEAADRGLRPSNLGSRPKPRPILIPVEARQRRR